MEANVEVTNDEIEFIANDIIGDLMNLRVIDEETPDEKLDLAATYIIRALQHLVERAKK
jgi:hypothetical protein